MVTCPLCQGSGRVAMVIATDECPACRASGQVAQEAVTFLRRQPALKILRGDQGDRLVG